LRPPFADELAPAHAGDAQKTVELKEFRQYMLDVGGRLTGNGRVAITPHLPIVVLKRFLWPSLETGA
jgi:hypothetical protein